MFSRFFYADAGILNNRGHHADVCRSIIGEARAYPFSTHVLAHADIEVGLRQELNAISFFHFNPYFLTDGDPACGWLNACHASAQIMLKDLERITDIASSDVFYFPAQAAQLMAVTLWLDNLPPERRPTVVIEFLFPSGLVAENSPNGKSFSLPDLRENPAPVLLRFSACRIPRIGPHRLRFGYSDSEGAAAYAALLDHPIHKMPSPQRALVEPHSRKGHDPITVSVLGHQHNAKGYALVPTIARRLLQSRSNVRILIHNSDPKSTPAIQTELHAMAAADTRLTLKERTVDVREWCELLDRTDIMLCPYDPEFYRYCRSGIVAEAVANGIPLVLPDETGAARMVAEFGDSGIAYKTTDVDAIVSALEQVIERFDSYAETALAGARQWLIVNGPKNMIESILTVAQTAA